MSRRPILLLTALTMVLSSCDGPIFGSPEVSASPEACLFQAEKSDAEIFVECDGKWTATLLHGTWASLSASSGKGNTSIRLNYAFNGQWSARTDSLVLKSGRNTTYVPLQQQGLESLFSVKELIINGADAVEFTASMPSDWKASSSADWLKVSPTEGVASSNISFKVYPSGECLDSDRRTASINLSIGGAVVSMPVSQSGTEKIILDSANRTVGCEGGLLEVNVGSNMNYTVDIDAAGSRWIERADTKAFTSSTVLLRVLPNKTREERMATVTFGLGRNQESITIIQSGWNAVLDTQSYGYYKDAEAIAAYDKYMCQISVTEGHGSILFKMMRPADGRFLMVDGLSEGLEDGARMLLAVVQNFDSSAPYREVKMFRVVKCDGERIWMSADDGTGLIIPRI